MTITLNLHESSAQQLALQVRLAQLQNQVQLYKVLGGGLDAQRQPG